MREACGAERGVPRGKWLPMDHGPTWGIIGEVSDGFAVRPEYPVAIEGVYFHRIARCETPSPLLGSENKEEKKASGRRVSPLAGETQKKEKKTTPDADRRCDPITPHSTNQKRDVRVDGGEVGVLTIGTAGGVERKRASRRIVCPPTGIAQKKISPLGAPEISDRITMYSTTLAWTLRMDAGGVGVDTIGTAGGRRGLPTPWNPKY